MDDNVPPYNTYLVADALAKANKDFDLIIFPNAGMVTERQAIHDAAPVGLLCEHLIGAGRRRIRDQA